MLLSSKMEKIKSSALRSPPSSGSARHLLPQAGEVRPHPASGRRAYASARREKGSSTGLPLVEESRDPIFENPALLRTARRPLSLHPHPTPPITTAESEGVVQPHRHAPHRDFWTPAVALVAPGQQFRRELAAHRRRELPSTQRVANRLRVVAPRRIGTLSAFGPGLEPRNPRRVTLGRHPHPRPDSPLA